MTREAAHLKSFEKALYAISPNFPPGKMPVDPRYAPKYFNMSQGQGDMRGPWNSDENFDYVTDGDQEIPADDDDGLPTVALSQNETSTLEAMAARTLSDPKSNPVTGTELGEEDGEALDKDL
jgi:Mn-containing catalase